MRTVAIREQFKVYREFNGYILKSKTRGWYRYSIGDKPTYTSCTFYAHSFPSLREAIDCGEKLFDHKV